MFNVKRHTVFIIKQSRDGTILVQHVVNVKDTKDYKSAMAAVYAATSNCGNSFSSACIFVELHFLKFYILEAQRISTYTLLGKASKFLPGFFAKSRPGQTIFYIAVAHFVNSLL